MKATDLPLAVAAINRNCPEILNHPDWEIVLSGPDYALLYRTITDSCDEAANVYLTAGGYNATVYAEAFYFPTLTLDVTVYAFQPFTADERELLSALGWVKETSTYEYIHR